MFCFLLRMLFTYAAEACMMKSSAQDTLMRKFHLAVCTTLCVFNVVRLSVIFAVL